MIFWFVQVKFYGEGYSDSHSDFASVFWDRSISWQKLCCCSLWFWFNDFSCPMLWIQLPLLIEIFKFSETKSCICPQRKRKLKFIKKYLFWYFSTVLLFLDNVKIILVHFIVILYLSLKGDEISIFWPITGNRNSEINLYLYNSQFWNCYIQKYYCILKHKFYSRNMIIQK